MPSKLKILLVLALCNISLFGAATSNDLRKSLETLKALNASAESTVSSLEKNPVRVVESPGTCSGRLTLSSGTPVPTSDLTAQSTLYFTPYEGNMIATYDGSSKWVFKRFSEFSLVLSSLTSGKNYDVFAYNNSGTMTLELSTAWNDDVTRNNALALQDGVTVKSTDHTRRWLGTIRTTSTTTTEDSTTKRFVWNHCNRQPRILKVSDTTNSWTYNNTNFRSVNASTANRVSYVVGSVDALVSMRTLALAAGSGQTISGMGIDSTSSNSAQLFGGAVPATYQQVWSDYVGFSALGYHFLQWLEKSSANLTFYGDNNGTLAQSGMLGTVEG